VIDFYADIRLLDVIIVTISYHNIDKS